MFQSNHQFGEFHAAARAISGGPIYITDQPNQHNVEILKRCIIKSVSFEIVSSSTIDNNNSQVCSQRCTHERCPHEYSQRYAHGRCVYERSPQECTQYNKIYSQRILRCDHPGLPSLSILFEDVTKVNRLLKMSNINNQRVGVLGLWNCQNIEIVDKFGIEDVYRMKIDDDVIINDDNVGKYALYFFKNMKTYKIKGANLHEQISIMVKPYDLEIVTISPMDVSLISEKDEGAAAVAKVEISCFGLIDKYNGSKAIDNVPKFVSEGFDNDGGERIDKKRTIIKIKENCKKGMVFYKVDLIGYGKCGFYLDVVNVVGRKNYNYEIKEIKVYLGNEMLKDEVINYNKENKLLTVSLNENENVTEGELCEYKRSKREMWEEKDEKLKLFLEIKIEIQ